MSVQTAFAFEDQWKMPSCNGGGASAYKQAPKIRKEPLSQYKARSSGSTTIGVYCGENGRNAGRVQKRKKAKKMPAVDKENIDPVTGLPATTATMRGRNRTALRCLSNDTVCSFAL